MANKNYRLPSIKTAVMVKDLIASIERIRDAELKEAKVAEATYKTQRAAYLKRVREHLRAKAALIVADFVPPNVGYRSGMKDWVVSGFPEKPVYPNDAKCIRAKYDTLIAQLRLSAEPKVRLSPEDFGKFMAGDASACPC